MSLSMALLALVKPGKGKAGGFVEGSVFVCENSFQG